MITKFIKEKKATMLCVGPMSKNCIDASIELSKQFNIPQILIASRRQIDAKEFGGGYVENFSTNEFAAYVKAQNAKNIFLARDHGGPWQGTFERNNNLNISDSMKIAKTSFEEDILAGFHFIHIDPSIPVKDETLNSDKILERLFELYGHTYEFAKKHNKNISFELGTEEQNGYSENLEYLEFFLNKTKQFCTNNKIQQPSFIVIQTGTKVMETKNIGSFTLSADLEYTIKQIYETVKICDKYGVMVKEHNADYLGDNALSLRPILGIHASNVAPEFGVIETKGFLYLLKNFGFHEEYELFIQIALKSLKWEKWILPQSIVTDLEKAIISGHYIFGNNEIKNIKQNVTEKLKEKNIYLDEHLKVLIKQSMTRYMQLFKMI